MKKSYASIAGMIAGAISVLCSLVVFTADKGSTVSYQSYGGDAYTGIQQAGAHAANNICDLANICSMGLGLILLALGLIAICYFLHQYLEDVKEEKNDGQKVVIAQETVDTELPSL